MATDTTSPKDALITAVMSGSTNEMDGRVTLAGVVGTSQKPPNDDPTRTCLRPSRILHSFVIPGALLFILATYLSFMLWIDLDVGLLGLSLLHLAAGFALAALLLDRRRCADGVWWMAMYISCAAAVFLGTFGSDFLMSAIWWGVSVLFIAQTVATKCPWGRYLVIGCALMGYILAIRSIIPNATHSIWMWLFMVPSILLALGTWLSSDPIDPTRGLRRAYWNRWSRPFLYWWMLLVLVTTVIAAQDPSTACAVWALHGIAIGTITTIWRGEDEVWVSLAYLLAAMVQGFHVVGMPIDKQIQTLGFVGVTLGLLGIVLQMLKIMTLVAWWNPLQYLAGSIPLIALPVALKSSVGVDLCLALLGLYLMCQGYHRRSWISGYGGAVILELAYFYRIITDGVSQIQAFVLPVGLLLLAIAFFEGKRFANRRRKVAIEIVGLILLLGTSLLQASGTLTFEEGRHFYVGFLIVEAAAVMSLGVILRWRYSFLLGMLAAAACLTMLLIEHLITLFG